MSNFEETIARMKGLYTYGKELNESNDIKAHTLEHHAIAADGKSYGIIKECSKYYIKSAPKDKEMVAEAYDYLGGFCNKRDYEYTSYANALKNFELKMASINEAHNGTVNISTLDPFRKEEYLVECTKNMKDEIARQRQIMSNASMIMNEANEIGASNKNNVVKYDGKNPETPKKNGNTINDGTDAKVVDQDKVKGFNGNKPHADKTGNPFTERMNEGACCGKCGKNPCECQGNCNEEAGDIGDAPLLPNTRNWGTEGINKGRNPEQIGWDMDDQETVNEETNEWDEGLPNAAGVGEADTDHNNDPFNNSINEEEEDTFSIDDEEETIDGDNTDELDSTEEDTVDAEFDGEDETFNDEDETEEDFDLNNDDFDTEDEDSINADFDLEMDNETEDEDLRSEIDSLKAEIETLKAQLDNNEDENFEEEDFEEDDFDENDGEEGFDEIEECGEIPQQMMESKRAKMNRIVESVVNQFLNEDELHVFGKHPGYRKKPMELPTTGEDQNQWGRDWNDESVHNEEPFGSKIGNGDPFTELVNNVTKDVMYQLKKGIPIEGANKKKVD